ncbi:zinc ribbon domain-containing protein, partial [Streptomyces sp. SID7982]|nr:zinc ribbon domain-containing protein [Streptomyces sp. SID7982]
FEVSRPMAQSSDPASCPAGHEDTVKLLSAVAVGGAAGSASAPSGGGGGGGCCGGGCCG